MRQKRTLSLGLILIIGLFFGYIYYQKTPAASVKFIYSNIDNYENFVDLAIKNNIGCINTDSIVDNNANFLFRNKENNTVPIRYMCDQGNRTNNLRRLYKELHIGEMSTFNDVIVLNIVKRGSNHDSLRSLVFIHDKNEFAKNNNTKDKKMINDRWYILRRRY